MTVAYSDKTVEDFRLGKGVIQKHTATGTGKVYFSVRIGLNTSVQINKAGSTVTLKGSNDFTLAANVDDAVYSTLKLSEGTDDYQQGHSAGLTSFEVDVTAFVGNVVIRVAQYGVE